MIHVGYGLEPKTAPAIMSFSLSILYLLLYTSLTVYQRCCQSYHMREASFADEAREAVWGDGKDAGECWNDIQVRDEPAPLRWEGINPADIDRILNAPHTIYSEDRHGAITPFNHFP